MLPSLARFIHGNREVVVGATLRVAWYGSLDGEDPSVKGGACLL